MYFVNKFNEQLFWQQENVSEKLEALVESNKAQATLIQELREEQRKQAEQISLLINLITFSSK
jgi:hypothetical protein